VPAVDPAFLALPLHQAAEAGLCAGADAGATHVDVRVQRLRGQDLSLRDAGLESLHEGVSAGLAVRVVVDGTWGFASSSVVTVEEAARLARQAAEVARTARPLNAEPVELADEPVHADRTWLSDYDVDPFDVEPSEKTALLAQWSRRLLASPDVTHVDVSLEQVL
jgi:TldD protein